MTDLHPRAREILAGDTLAFLTTLEADGRPQVTGIWVGFEGDEIVSAHLGCHRKLQNIQRDLGPDAVFPPMPDPPPGWIVRTTIERVGGSGPWARRG